MMRCMQRCCRVLHPKSRAKGRPGRVIGIIGVMVMEPALHPTRSRMKAVSEVRRLNARMHVRAKRAAEKRISTPYPHSYPPDLRLRR